MHKNKLILVLGIIVAALPYSGFAWNTKKILIAIVGLLIAVLAVLVERHIKISFHWPRKRSQSSTATTYIEHNGAARAEEVRNKTV
jgi:4-amino-4-deoxy-L-arabinose transferase-like glycosyltransferase